MVIAQRPEKNLQDFMIGRRLASLVGKWEATLSGRLHIDAVVAIAVATTHRTLSAKFAVACRDVATK